MSAFLPRKLSFRKLFPLFIAGLLPAQLSAQSTSERTNSSEHREDEPVVLNPFEVRAEKDTGYQATETLAGTRIRSDLRDVGAAITVLTREFLDDIGAVDNLTLLQYTPNVEVGGTHSTFAGTGSSQSVSENVTNPSSNTRVRGLSTADNTRDFFVSDIPWDGYNVDRIDIQRGPNSILFGLGKPAGIVNATLRGAEFRNKIQYQNRFGSYGSIRNSLDINQVLLRNQLAIRLIGLDDRENYSQKPAYKDDQRTYATVRWDPAFLRKNGLRTTLRIKFEDGKIRSNNPRTLTPNDNVSHFFRPATVSAANPWGGLGKGVFDPYNAAAGSTVGGDNQGQLVGTDPDYNPWINANNIVQQQQPVYLIDGGTGALYQAYGGLVPYQVRTSTGAIGGSTNIPAGFPANSAPFLAVNSPQDFARLYQLPNYQAGLYRQWGLQDASVFDFYNILIDGPTKWELKKWDAYNIDLAQTAFGDRLGVNLTFDRQSYKSSNESFLGSPSLNVDLSARFQDLSVNPNAGRAFVSGAGGGGWTATKREVSRASVFGELRSTDFLREGFWTKLLGHHRFNGVFAEEKYEIENRGYLLNAPAQSWNERRYTAASAATAAFDDRRPVGVVYLGPSLLAYNTATGLNLPGIQTQIALNDAPLNHYWTVWNAPSSVAFGSAWNRAADPVWSQYPKTGTFVQADNPANYVGWTRDFVLDMVQASDGSIDYLSTSASKQLRKTKSLVGTWQSFWWQDAVVGTLGWRYDAVSSKAVGATRTGTIDHNHLWLSPEDPPAGYPTTVKRYRYPDAFDTLKDHSVSGGVVLHLNRLLRKDPLPILVSLAYNRSANFEVTNRRVDLYGDILPNPSGRTEDWGLRLGTKDGKYSMRITRYEASVQNSTSSDFGTSTIGAIMETGLEWRNVFKYDLSGYDWTTRNAPGARNNFSARPGETAADAAALETAAIAAWDELQAKVDPRLYAAWGFDPNNGAETVAEQNKMANWTSRAPANFSITEDVTAKGMEFEFTANPAPNWRIFASASKSQSYQTNIGGESLVEYVDLITHYMNDTPAGKLRQFSGGATATTFQDIWNSGFYARWILKRLQQGAAAPEIRKWRYTVTSNYSFRKGFLKGAGIGGSYRWEDKSAIGYPLLITQDGFRYDLNKPYFGPSQDAIDLWLSYERKLTKKLGWKVQLNVRNAFAEKGLIPVTLQPDGTTWAQVRTKPMQEWFVTNTFSF